MITLLMISLLSLPAWAQVDNQESSDIDYPVVDFKTLPVSEYRHLGLTPEHIQTMSLQSQKHLIENVETKPINTQDYSLLGVEVKLPRTNLFPPSAQANQAKIGLSNLESLPGFGGSQCSCSDSGFISQLAQDNNQVINFMEQEKYKEKKFNPGMIYFIWGYNRSWHTRADATFNTPDGTFTIKDAKGEDRPTKTLSDYYTPSKMLIPQYNIRLGYQLNPSWSLEFGQDHMKWIFDNEIRYQVEGDYNHTVFVPHPSGDPGLLQGLNFDEVKQTGDMRWLKFEHSDGYNYVHLAGVYKHNLFSSKNEKFKIDALGGAGLGLMVPKTKVIFHQDQWWNFEGLDNRFHVAGFGGHAEGKLRMTYGKAFIEAAGRGTYIKINNALVAENIYPGARLEHEPIGSIQFIIQAGVNYPLGSKKKKKRPDSLNP